MVSKLPALLYWPDKWDGQCLGHLFPDSLQQSSGDQYSPKKGLLRHPWEQAYATYIHTHTHTHCVSYFNPLGLFLGGIGRS